MVTEYDSDTSCHYKMELSYENFITSGPDPHPPPIADDESDDDDDDDIPRVSGTGGSGVPCPLPDFFTAELTGSASGFSSG